MNSIHRRRSPFIFALGLLVAGCAPTDEPVAIERGIIGGALAPDDSATVLVVLQKLPDQESLCSGTIVAPHVVLTAAHCVDERVTGEGFTHYIFTGDDINDAAQADDRKRWVMVKATHFDPSYDPGVLSGDHDIGVIVTKTKLTPTPLPMLRRPLADADRGKVVRVLGYGRTDAADTVSSGTRYQLDSTITDVTTGELVRNVEGRAETCVGDSGGPTLLDDGDGEVVAGVHSWGEHASTCTGANHDARVDTHWDFLAPLIEAADPGFLPPAPPPDMTPPVDFAPAPHTDGGCAIAPAATSDGALWLLLALPFARARRRQKQGTAASHCVAARSARYFVTCLPRPCSASSSRCFPRQLQQPRRPRVVLRPKSRLRSLLRTRLARHSINGSRVCCRRPTKSASWRSPGVPT